MGKLPTGDWAANCAYFQLIVFAYNLRWGQDAPRDWIRRAGQHSTPVQRTVAGYMPGSTETANVSV